jgi:hypothetical protein
MGYKGIESDIEVSGPCLGAIVDGFKAFRLVAMKVLRQHGLMAEKQTDVDVEAWYPSPDS